MPGRRLSLAEREEIMAGLARDEPVRQIAARLGRAPSTVSREARNISPSPWRYRAFPAQIKAMTRGRRARPRKLAAGTAVRVLVAGLLREDYSPGQIAGRLKRDYPGRPELQVSHETIYQALFVQGKGSLRTTYLFRWHAVVGAGTGVTCDVQTYIPTENAGDPDTVYKIYADNGSGGLTYRGQRGPYNQEKLSGWLDLGNWTVVNNYMLTVILSNQSGISPGAWYVGAGDMSWNCNG